MSTLITYFTIGILSGLIAGNASAHAAIDLIVGLLASVFVVLL